MINYEELPLFPLHVVLYPDMPLPLHIFEPRYREMVLHCREENAPFGIVLIRDGEEVGEAATPHRVGTAARITHHDELPEGRMNIIVTGETRFRIHEIFQDRPYLTARVETIRDEENQPDQLAAPFETVRGLFKGYLKTLFSQTGRPLSTLQLPQDPECLSYAIAMFLQSSLAEKQELLEMTSTQARLTREIEMLNNEIEVQEALRQAVRHDGLSVIVPVDTEALGKLASRN